MTHSANDINLLREAADILRTAKLKLSQLTRSAETATAEDAIWAAHDSIHETVVDPEYVWG
jgi:hypothetical protein